MAAAVPLGPWLARLSRRLIDRYTAAGREHPAGPGAVRTVLTTLAFGLLIAGALLLVGIRPATVALAWAAGAGVVLAAVDLATHRLPDRVTLPAVAACTTAFLVDAAATGTWPAAGRAALAAAGTFAAAAAAAALAPGGLGFGDVKLLGLLGLLLGWAGWGVLMAGVFLGLLTGALLSLLLVATRRVGWRSAVPFGPPLLVGAALALTLAGPL